VNGLLVTALVTPIIAAIKNKPGFSSFAEHKNLVKELIRVGYENRNFMFLLKILL